MLMRSLLIITLGVGEVLIGASAWAYSGMPLGLFTLGCIFVINYFVLNRMLADQHYQARRKAHQMRIARLSNEQKQMFHR